MQDFDFNDEYYGQEDDAEANEEAARERVKAIVNENRDAIYYSRQIEIMLEKEFFHWVTNRAIRSLAESGFLKITKAPLEYNRTINLITHKSKRYITRDAAPIVGLVKRYSQQIVSEALGERGESLTLEGFASIRFVMEGRGARQHNGAAWEATAHDLDFIFSRDGQTYGIEVKNTLSYIEKPEFLTKIAMCEHLGITPVFVCRMLPKSYINLLNEHGGFALIMKYQLYPTYMRDLATAIREQLGLPVDTPRHLQANTMRRFEVWHEKRVNL
jgi:hypothetical protein